MNTFWAGAAMLRCCGDVQQLILDRLAESEQRLKGLHQVKRIRKESLAHCQRSNPRRAWHVRIRVFSFYSTLALMRPRVAKTGRDTCSVNSRTMNEVRLIGEVL